MLLANLHVLECVENISDHVFNVFSAVNEAA